MCASVGGTLNARRHASVREKERKERERENKNLSHGVDARLAGMQRRRALLHGRSKTQCGAGSRAMLLNRREDCGTPRGLPRPEAKGTACLPHVSAPNGPRERLRSRLVGGIVRVGLSLLLGVLCGPVSGACAALRVSLG